MNLLAELSSIEENYELHLGRLLILLGQFSEGQTPGSIEGLTKMAKLDFLLRYPTFLERALIAKKKDSSKVKVRDFERQSVESKMVRFRYGPWDFRYRRFLNILIAKRMVIVEPLGRTIKISLTSLGKLTADRLMQSEAFKDIAVRARLVRLNFDFSGTHLMRFVYATFPEISSLQYGNKIDQ